MVAATEWRVLALDEPAGTPVTIDGLRQRLDGQFTDIASDRRGTAAELVPAGWTLVDSGTVISSGQGDVRILLALAPTIDTSTRLRPHTEWPV